MKRFFLLTCLLTGCMVGPDYQTPFVEMPIEYCEDENPSIFPEEDLQAWWTIFNDPFLDELLEEAIAENFDYRIALQQIAIARAQYWVAFTQILPAIESDFQATHFRTSRSFANSTPTSHEQSFFQTGFDAIWQLDVFGGLRRAAEQAWDTVEATAEAARAVKLLVLSEVANAYVLINTYQLKVALAADVVAFDEELVALSRARFEAGLANEQEYEALKGSLETDRALLLSYETTLKQTIYGLAVLLGRTPECVMQDFQINRPIPMAAGRIPLGVPGDLLRRRPDIAQAERELAAATAGIGVAVAALYPTFNLTGSSSSFAANPLQGANVGFSADHFSKLFNPASLIWGIGTLITWPVFNFGGKQAAVRAQMDTARQAYLTYQKTIIVALQEVEQGLVAYHNEEQRLDSLFKASEANRKVWDLTSMAFEAGLATYSQVLQDKQAWSASMTALADSQQAVATDLIAIYKALGGDW